jgi:hypothetical protein
MFGKNDARVACLLRGAGRRPPIAFRCCALVSGGVPSQAAAATVLWLCQPDRSGRFGSILALPITFLTLAFSAWSSTPGGRLTDSLLPVIEIRGTLTCLGIALVISVANASCR